MTQPPQPTSTPKPIPWLLFAAFAAWTALAFAMLYPSLEEFKGWHFALLWRIVALVGAATLLIASSRSRK